MTQRQKIELALNQPTEIELLFNDPITGQSKYGDYFMYAVSSNGSEYSYFPPEEVHEQLKNLSKGSKAIITKTATQKGAKLVTSYNVSFPSTEKLNTDKKIPEKSENFPAQLNSDLCGDHYYEIMLKSYRDALKIQQELSGMVDPSRIAITLFIARSKDKNGEMQEK